MRNQRAMERDEDLELLRFKRRAARSFSHVLHDAGERIVRQMLSELGAVVRTHGSVASRALVLEVLEGPERRLVFGERHSGAGEKHKNSPDSAAPAHGYRLPSART